MKRIVLALLVLCATTLSAQQQPNKLTELKYDLNLRPISLNELIDRAHRIFLGTLESEENRQYQEILGGKAEVSKFTFTYIEALKAPTGERKFDFFVAPLVDTYMPRTKGQEFLLFVSGASSIGFSAPIGVSSGQFSVTSQEGRKLVQNFYDNKDLWGMNLWKTVSMNHVLTELGRRGYAGSLEEIQKLGSSPAPAAPIPYDLVAAVVAVRLRHK